MASNSNNKIQLYSPQFYTYCAIGGALACGVTHAGITPLDVVKCRIQTGHAYKGTLDGVKTIYKEAGASGLVLGWAPTLVGYSMQGAAKYGFYELFKKQYTDWAGTENAYKYRMYLYAAASASAEVIADVALCPWESIKVRIQTQPNYARGLMDGMPKFVSQEGVAGLYKILGPLWARQIPYTIMKFTSFERTVEYIYASILGKEKSQYSKAQQLAVSFVAGYFAGVFCATVSHPADVIVSKLNKNPEKGVVAIAKELGLMGMWSGLGVRIIMVGTLTAFQWFIYDTFKVATGLPTTGGATEKKH